MRIAFCMYGAVGKKSIQYGKKIFNLISLDKEIPYVNFKACYTSIKEHIFDANPGITFDVFMHCWSHDLESELVNLYQPKLFLFEENGNYYDEIYNKTQNGKGLFSMTSQILSMKKSLHLKERFEHISSCEYDMVIFYRYDVLLWKDIPLSKYHVGDNSIYVNAHMNKDGDFHFIMNSLNATQFVKLYDHLGVDFVAFAHYTFKMFILNYMQVKLYTDDIIPGYHQEVFRKITHLPNSHLLSMLIQKFYLTDNDLEGLIA